jgi:hypothetical protein
MPQKNLLAIPLELQQIKAFQLYQERLFKGEDANPEVDWENARKYLSNSSKEILIWKCKRLFVKLSGYGKRKIYRLFQLFKLYLQQLQIQNSTRGQSLEDNREAG